MKNFICIVFLIFATAIYSQDIKVETRRGWTKTISASDISEAGIDYVGTYDSDHKQTEITIDKTKKHDFTAVLVRKDDDFGDWHSKLNLQIRRTDNNNSDSYGGTEFQTITDMNSYFFITKGNQEDVPLQYRINGISVLLPVQDYKTTIIFTVYDY